MIKFYCNHCQKKLGVPDEFAGKIVKCNKCQQPTRVPKPNPQPEPVLQIEPSSEPHLEISDENIRSDELLSSGSSYLTEQLHSPDRFSCPNCQSPVARDSQSCLNCGQQLESAPRQEFEPEPVVGGTIAAAKPSAPSLPRFPIAIAGSFAGALLGGAIWAGIVYVSGYELGIVAWGIGILAGFGAAFLTPERTTRLGLVAAAMAVAGIVIGKIIIIQWIMAPEIAKYINQEGVPEDVVMELISDPEAMFNIACYTLMADGAFNSELADQIMDSFGLDDLTGVSPEAIAGRIKVQSFLGNSSLAEKKIAIQEYFVDNAELITESYISESGFWAIFKDTLSFWDILWVLLAVSSAYKIGAGITSND